MPITSEVLDQILKDYEKPEELLSDNGLLRQLILLANPKN